MLDGLRLAMRRVEQPVVSESGLMRERELQGYMDAIHRVQAVIEFALDGTVLEANENFLRTMGYRLDEVRGKHHSMFMPAGVEESQGYRDFWAKLRRGEYDRGEYKRVSKAGKEVWLLASYNPVFGARGELVKIMEFATDVSAEKLRTAEFEGQMAAIHRVQGVIEFDLQGKILTANPMFLELMGYGLEEITGRHHSMFVQPGEQFTDEYQGFWRNLREGHADACVYRRIGKDGRVVWIQASYNPIFDAEGRPVKVVKFATDLTGLITETEATQRTAESVAAASAAMARSLGEIARNMEMSREATGRIAANSRVSGEEARRMLESMEAVTRIVGTIRSIAGQTDLLALNATIEAARAGEAGRGFAVVAKEVTVLSDRTSQANDEIGAKIDAAQEISTRVAESVQGSLEGIDRVNEYVSSVARAIEEQSAAIAEISAHSRQTVRAVESILSQTRRVRDGRRGGELRVA